MIKFELKKLLKSRKILLLIIFSFLISLYSTNFVDSDNFEKYQDENLIKSSGFPLVNFSNEDLYYLYNTYTSDVEENIIKLENELDNVESEEDKKNLISQLNRNYLELNNKKIDFAEEVKSKHPNKYSSLDEEILNNVKWQQTKYSKIVENNSQDYYNSQNRLGDNIIQYIISISNIIYGAIPIIFISIIFFNIFSVEYETNSIYLIYTQPSKRYKVILSKIIAQLSMVILYITLVTCFTFIFLYLKGYRLNNGFYDIYRLFDTKNSFNYIFGWKLLLLIISAFCILTVFWMLLISLLSKVFGSNRGFASFISIFSIAYLFTTFSPQWKNIYNPFFAINSGKIILGRFEDITKNAVTSSVLYKNYKFAHYFIYILAILIFIVLLIKLHNINSIKVKNTDNKKINSIFKFELVKIYKSKTFLIFSVVFIVIVLGEIISKNSLYKDLESTYMNNEVINAEYLDSLDTYKKELEKLKDDNYILSIAFPEGEEEKTIEDVSNELKMDIDAQIEMYTYEINNLEEKMKLGNDLINEYNLGKNGSFYEKLSEFFSNNFESYMYLGKGLQSDSLSGKSLDFSKEIFSVANENKSEPMPFISLLISPYEKFDDISYIEENEKENVLPANSAVTLPYNLLKTHKIDIIILTALALSFFLGYTIEKQDGKHLDLIFTTPINKYKYYLAKIFSQYISALILFSVFILIFIVSGYISDGFRGWNFPIPIYNLEQFRLEALYIYLIKVVIGIAISMFFVLTLMVNLSYFVKNRYTLFISSVSTICALYLITIHLPAGVKIYSPFIYLRSSTLANQIISLTENINITYLSGLGILVFWSIINIVIGIFLTKIIKNRGN